jgi:2-pyrone-4,6-dicarboxylate lactonase
MTERPQTWHPAPHATTVRLPAGATDCHCHVFGPTTRFPFADHTGAGPADAPKKTLFALHDAMGIDRCVIVQSGTHGFDNSVVVDAMQARPGRYLGVALAPPDLPDAALDTLRDRGFRAIRFNYMSHLKPGADEAALRALAPRLADRDMHLQVHMESGLIADMAPVLADLPITVVIDHFGRVDASLGMDHPHYQSLIRLLDHDNLWCKVSGIERASRAAPPYDDAMPFAADIVARHPDRVLWGTDWPHPNYRTDPPDDGDLFDLLPRIAPTPVIMQALLVDNPTELYRFEQVTQ